MKMLNQKILFEEYQIKKVLKSNQRSKVLLIEIDNKEFVYKVPIEKNTRVWQRIISIFRGSESKREFDSYNRILENGFKGPKPISYWERKSFFMSVDSFLILEYIEGNDAKVENIKEVAKELDRIHEKGFLHGDSQLANFKIVNGEIYLIDAKFEKNKFGKIGEKHEFLYLEKSCHNDNLNFYNKNTISYKIVKGLDNYLEWYGGIKKKIRRKER